MTRTRTTVVVVLVGLISSDVFGLISPSRSGIVNVAERWVAIPRAASWPSSLAARRSGGPVPRDDDAPEDDESRRRLVDRAFSSSLAFVASSVFPRVASARVVSSPTPSSSSSSSAQDYAASSSSSFAGRRDALLRAISSKSNDDVIAKAIDDLLPYGPFVKSSSSSSSSSYESALDGSWKLLWYNKSDFSPLLKLPRPFRPDSYQYFGPDASREVGEGRAAQGLAGGVVSAFLGRDAELWLSSGVVATTSTSTSTTESSTASSLPSTLIICPPFRLQIGTIPMRGEGGTGTKTAGSGNEKRTIVESDSDADFRRVNARSDEAQLAPRNEYEQSYLEDFGPGSLRISVIARGDPVIVGDMFVHQKM